MKNTILTSLLLIALAITTSSNAQVGIGIATANINPSAQLDVTSTTKGFLLPRMTNAQKTAIVAPSAGLQVWCADCGASGELQVFNGNNWTNTSGSAASLAFPRITTAAITGLTIGATTSATSGGTISGTGGETVVSGVCWSTTTNPTVALTTKTTNGPTTIGSFSSSITGLTNYTLYYVRAYATNSSGTSYGNEVIIGCGAKNTSGTFLTFACYNLGATSTGNAMTYQAGANNGSLYQWGRPTDGHQIRVSGTTTSLATNTTATLPTEVVGKFISTSADWMSPPTNTLWGDGTTGANPVKAANDPCPSGFKVPSQAQWGSIFAGGVTQGAPALATANVWTWTGNGYTVGSALYLPAAGGRNYDSTSGNVVLSDLGTYGYYWSSTVNGASAYYLAFVNGFVAPGYGITGIRGYGDSVRCISQ
jgi:uncharacterized protein (TIGR02145 family)